MEQQVSHDKGEISRSFTTVAKGSSLLIVGVSIGYLFSFVKRVVLVRSLAPAQYGLLVLGMSIATIVMVFSSLGLHAGTQRFIAINRGRGDLGRVKGSMYSAAFMLTIAVLFTMVCLVVLARPVATILDKPGLAWVIFVLAFMIPAMEIDNIIVAFYQGFETATPKVFFIDLGLNFSVMALVILAAFSRRTLGGMMLAIVLGHWLAATMLCVYLKQRVPEAIKGVKPILEPRKLLLFSLPLAVSASIGVLTFHADVVMLGYFEESIRVGIYSGAVVLYQTLLVFNSAVEFMFGPVAARMIGENKDSELRLLYSSVTKWLTVFMIPLWFIFFCYPSQTIELVFGSEYIGAAFALQMLSLGQFMFVAMGPAGMALIAYGRTKLIMVDSVAVVVSNIIMNWLLISWLGINGAAIATCVSVILGGSLMLGQLHSFYRINPFTANYNKTVLAGITGTLVFYFPLRFALKYTLWVLPFYYVILLVATIGSMFFAGAIDDLDREFYQKARQKVRTVLRQRVFGRQ